MLSILKSLIPSELLRNITGLVESQDWPWSDLKKYAMAHHKMIDKWGAIHPDREKHGGCICPKCGSGGTNTLEHNGFGSVGDIWFECDECNTAFKVLYVSVGIVEVEFNEEDGGER